MCAARLHGAQYGVGVGRTGQSYAIPTKDTQIKTLPLDRITAYVQDFLTYARQHPTTRFHVTRIGCGLAGYTDAQIAPMFAHAPTNCVLPVGWRRHEHDAND